MDIPTRYFVYKPIQTGVKLTRVSMGVYTKYQVAIRKKGSLTNADYSCDKLASISTANTSLTFGLPTISWSWSMEELSTMLEGLDRVSQREAVGTVAHLLIREATRLHTIVLKLSVLASRNIPDALHQRGSPNSILKALLYWTRKLFSDFWVYTVHRLQVCSPCVTAYLSHISNKTSRALVDGHNSTISSA
ncbi:hypothetical protein MSG28_011035 [Choristoneura fumiferana]|uniref:Uncharacterized protein n=1 Tax=Choristoneura fumiferana TaxID=7141 RepID=A0ACC0KQZ8_CHOFU|nr:hypothetical protein MSG28_011035 [Choristoneura fumiferana]